MAKPAPRPIHGRVVAITGGARGIGRATATALVREGARVAIGDLDGELTASVARELGDGVVGAALDVTDRDSFAAFLDQVETALGPIDVLVNNAGIMPLGDFAEETDESAARQIDINLHGVITGTRLAVRRMRPRRTGHVVNLASYVGKVSPPGGATYVATKHAVVGLTESVAMENEEYGIEFSIVMPGVVQTELTAGMRDSRGVKSVPPEEVAEAIVAALRVPRLEVYVPKELGPLHKATYILPRRAQLFVARAFRSDRILQDIDHRARHAYEERAARSAPAGKAAGDQAPTAPPGEPAGEAPAEPAVPAS